MVIQPMARQPLLVVGDACSYFGEFGLQLCLLRGPGRPDLLVGPQPLPQSSDLATGQIDPQGLELRQQIGMAPGRLGLLLQGPQPSPHL